MRQIVLTGRWEDDWKRLQEAVRQLQAWGNLMSGCPPLRSIDWTVDTGNFDGELAIDQTNLFLQDSGSVSIAPIIFAWDADASVWRWVLTLEAGAAMPLVAGGTGTGDGSIDQSGVSATELRFTSYGGSVPIRISNSTHKADLQAYGHIKAMTVGRGLAVKEGTNAKQGLATLVAGTVVVNTTAVTASSRIFLTPQETGLFTGSLRVSARVAGTSFTILSTVATDTCTVAWEIFEPAA